MSQLSRECTFKKLQIRLEGNSEVAKQMGN